MIRGSLGSDVAFDPTGIIQKAFELRFKGLLAF
jgi:hypothetical protein